MSDTGVTYDGRMAAVYDAGRRLLPEAEDGWADTVRSRVPVGATIVDVGAGTGRFARLFAERFAARVVAVEPAAAMRAAGSGAGATRHPDPPVPPGADPTGRRGAAGRAEATEPAAPGAVRPAATGGAGGDGRAQSGSSGGVWWVAGRAEQLPLAGGRADVVWLSCVVHYLDLDAAGAELARVARRPGGRVLVRSTFPDRFDELEWMRWFPTSREVDEARMPSVERLAQAWAPHGLRLEARLPSSHVIARDLHELVARLEHRAISTLELIPDAEFEQGLRALRAHAARVPPRPSYSAMEVLSFQTG